MAPSHSKPADSLRRLDAALVAAGLATSEAQARALVSAGMVEVDGVRATAASQRVSAVTTIAVAGPDHPWASRAGLKLDAALTAFGIDCRDRIALDAGASTGGFVSVLIARGARRVYAIDVGRGQLLPSLAQDERIVVMDSTNLRTLTELPGDAPSLITLDLAFISLRAIIPALLRIASGAEIVALFKPQFELPRDAVSPGGVVDDPSLTESAVRDFLEWMALTHSAPSLHDPIPAAVRGAKGNQEWLVHLRLPGVEP